MEFKEVEYADAEEDQEVQLSKWLNYPIPVDELYGRSLECTERSADSSSDEAVKPM